MALGMSYYPSLKPQAYIRIGDMEMKDLLQQFPGGLVVTALMGTRRDSAGRLVRTGQCVGQPPENEEMLRYVRSMAYDPTCNLYRPYLFEKKGVYARKVPSGETSSVEVPQYHLSPTVHSYHRWPDRCLWAPRQNQTSCSRPLLPG